MFEALQKLPELSVTEIDNLKKVIQDLFRNTCILQMKYDPETLVPRNNPRYKICVDYRPIIADYLELLGCELIHDATEQIFRIAGDGAVVEKMSLMTTRILVLLKLIYHDKIMGEGLQATVTNLAQIREYGADTRLLTRKLTDQEWQEALVLLKTHQVISYNGAATIVEDYTPIYIYSTINIYCKTASLAQLVDYYKAEEVTHETRQEDIY
ncbi:MAG: DUF4194 domain-containing protein [Eubacteriales bacterium]